MILEKTARTIEDAIENGLRDLKITTDQANIEIVQHPAKGFFGIGKKEACVRITLKSDDIEETKALMAEIGRDLLSTNAEHLSKKDEYKQAPSETVKQLAETFLRELTQAMGVNPTIVIKNMGKNLNIELSGENMGVLIGKRGITLEAIQNITNLIVNKGEGSYVNIIIDIENYRERRKENLQALAMNLARRVQVTGKSVTLEPMTSSERRIIHYALEKEKRVYTESKGTDPYRYIVIRPKNG